MSQQMMPPETTEGYEPPFNTQFSIFLDNRVGMLLPLVELFEGKTDDRLKLVALSVVDTADYAVVRVVTSCAELAKQQLKKAKFPFSEAEILVVELAADQTLSTLCATLLRAEINIYYAYPLMVRPHGTATIGLHTDNQFFAGQILRKHKFILLGEDELCDGGDA